MPNPKPKTEQLGNEERKTPEGYQTVSFRMRLRDDLVERFKAMTTTERGEFIEALVAKEEK